MKKIVLFFVLTLCVLNLQAQKVSILGDSYSTFLGQITPSWNVSWYGEGEKENNVKEADQCWWKILLRETGYELDKNNSFSGSTVCYTGYEGKDYTDRAFITRMCNLGNPDIILVFGGTNDSWANVPIGYYIYDNWTRQQLYSFRPAFCCMMDYLVKNYPNARIINICNSELSPEVTESETEICQHFHIENILLQDIEKQWGHPSQAGMKAIAEQILKILR